MVRKECWIHLLAYNLIRRVMVRIGKLHGIKARLLSFKQSVVFIEAFLSRRGSLLSLEGMRFVIGINCYQKEA